MSLSTDFGVVQKGMQQTLELSTAESPEETGVFNTYKNTLGYLSLFLMLKGFYNIKNFTPYVLLGPRVDYRIMTEAQIDAIIYSESNKLIWGLTYRAGVEYKFKKLEELLLKNTNDYNLFEHQ